MKPIENGKKQFRGYPQRQIRLSDKEWNDLIAHKKKSGEKWNDFIKSINESLNKIYGKRKNH
jgi:hypothetical protein